MKIINMLIATVALSGALVTTAHARDSFSIGINIGGHDHHASHVLRTHRHTPAYFGHYRSAPRIVYYTSPVRYRHYRHNSYYGSRHFDHAYRGGHHYKKHARKHHRRHHNRGYGYNNGWR